MKSKFNPDEKITYGTLHFAFIPRTIEVWEDQNRNTYRVFWSFYWSTVRNSRSQGIVGTGSEQHSFKKPKFDVYHPGPNLFDLMTSIPYWFLIGLIYEIFN